MLTQQQRRAVYQAGAELCGGSGHRLGQHARTSSSNAACSSSSRSSALSTAAAAVVARVSASRLSFRMAVTSVLKPMRRLPSQCESFPRLVKPVPVLIQSNLVWDLIKPLSHLTLKLTINPNPLLGAGGRVRYKVDLYVPRP
jgi:hypothetical protein